MLDLQLPLWGTILVFLVAWAVIAAAGTRLARLADHLADRTGLGEALMGSIFLGATTSLPGIVTSTTAAAAGHPEMAVANAIGGMAAQTAFLAIADFFHRKANLEHAAASVPNMLSGGMLIVLLAIILFGADAPSASVWSINPTTIVLIVAYVFGMRIIHRSAQSPQWQPKKTRFSQVEPPPDQTAKGESLAWMWIRFAIYAALTGIAGWAIARSGIQLVQNAGLSESLVGGIFTAVSTSTPELVTAVAAVRQGALKLAVADIIGGNTFDVLFVAAADIAYREGSIYHAVGADSRLMIALTMVMTGILLMGLIHREAKGWLNIGFESVLILVVYITGLVILTLGG